LPIYVDADILLTNTDLFSRIYALKKVINENDGKAVKKDIVKILSKAKLDIYVFEILPSDWESRYDRTNNL